MLSWAVPQEFTNVERRKHASLEKMGGVWKELMLTVRMAMVAVSLVWWSGWYYLLRVMWVFSPVVWGFGVLSLVIAKISRWQWHTFRLFYLFIVFFLLSFFTNKKLFDFLFLFISMKVNIVHKWQNLMIQMFVAVCVQSLRVLPFWCLLHASIDTFLTEMCSFRNSVKMWKKMSVLFMFHSCPPEISPRFSSWFQSHARNRICLVMLLQRSTHAAVSCWGPRSFLSLQCSSKDLILPLWRQETDSSIPLAFTSSPPPSKY